MSSILINVSGNDVNEIINALGGCTQAQLDIANNATTDALKHVDKLRTRIEKLVDENSRFVNNEITLNSQIQQHEQERALSNDVSECDIAYKRGHDDALAEKQQENESYVRKAMLLDILAHRAVDLLIVGNGTTFLFRPLRILRYGEFSYVSATIDQRGIYNENEIVIVGHLGDKSNTRCYAASKIAGWKPR